MSVSLPDFLIVGAAKSGTTSLYHYLEQHPEVYFSPVKEPLFFCSVNESQASLEKELYPLPLDKVVRNFDDYKALFSAVNDEQAVGEASVYYLLDHKKTIKNIKQYLPQWQQLKIIIILRNPVDASFSHYQMYTQYLKNFRGHKDVLSFEESLDAEAQRIKDGYMALSPFHWFFYYEQVKDYMDNFANVRIFLQTDLRDDPDRLIADIFDFIGVDNTFVPDFKTERYNVSGVPRSGFLYRFLISDGIIRKMLRPVLRLFLSPKRKQWLLQKIWQKNLKKISMEPEIRKRLIALYRDDIQRLEKLIDKDLSAWLNS